MKRINSMRMSLRSVKLVLVLGLIAGAQALSATTLVVGNCKSGGSYSTIQAAINAAPSGAIAQVCPGGYPEQVQITRAVTLEGIPSNDNDWAEIDPPTNGLTQTVAADAGMSVAYQVWVNNSPGPVNISNIRLAGTYNLVSSCPPAIAGIFYQNSPGTINEVTAAAQNGNGCGVGIWVEGGSSNPSVTVENSVVIFFDYLGIFAETSNTNYTPELTAKITSNSVLSGLPVCYAGIVVESGTTSTVTKNLVDQNYANGQGSYGILIPPFAAGSVSANTVKGYLNGIQAGADGVPVTSNTLVNNLVGINLQTAFAAIKQNNIIQNGTGIEFNCLANPNVVSNTISATGTGFDRVPSGLGTSTNKVFNTGVIRTGLGC